MRFNLTAVLSKWGKKIESGLRRRMNGPHSAQVGVDGKAYADLKPKTIAQKERDGFGHVKDVRMIRTKDFQNNAFVSSASGNTLTVEVSGKLHGRDLKSMRSTIAKHKANPNEKSAGQIKKTGANWKSAMQSRISYKEIAEYQLDKGSKFFPDSVDEINAMQEVKDMIPDLHREVQSQIKEDLRKTIESLNAKGRR